MKRLFHLFVTLILLTAFSGCTIQEAPAEGGKPDSFSAPSASSTETASRVPHSSDLPNSSAPIESSNASFAPSSRLENGKTSSAASVSSRRSSSSRAAGGQASSQRAAVKASSQAASSKEKAPQTETPVSNMVWVSRTGKKYHSNPNCSNMKSPLHMSREEAAAKGRTPCQKCY